MAEPVPPADAEAQAAEVVASASEAQASCAAPAIAGSGSDLVPALAGAEAIGEVSESCEQQAAAAADDSPSKEEQPARATSPGAAQESSFLEGRGVLLLPQRPGSWDLHDLEDSEGPELSWFAGKEALAGWGDECELEESAPERQLELYRRDKQLSEYVTTLCRAERGRPPLPVPPAPPPLEKLKEMAESQPPPTPAQGPSLLQLARDPKRREECSACAAEWSRAVQQLADPQKPPVPAEEAASSAAPAARRRAAAGRKTHSAKCTWLWFQQNLTESLCALRFDPQGEPRPCPQTPSRVLPPAMMDVCLNAPRPRGRVVSGDRTDRGAKGDNAV